MSYCHSADFFFLTRCISTPHRSHSPVSPKHNSTSDHRSLTWNKASITLDLKKSGGLVLFKDLLAHIIILLDPFSLSVLEPLSLNPPDLLAANRRLIIAQLTGFR